MLNGREMTDEDYAAYLDADSEARLLGLARAMAASPYPKAMAARVAKRHGAEVVNKCRDLLRQEGRR